MHHATSTHRPGVFVSTGGGGGEGGSVLTQELAAAAAEPPTRTTPSGKPSTAARPTERKWTDGLHPSRNTEGGPTGCPAPWWS